MIQPMETSPHVVEVLHLQPRNHELAKTSTGIRGLDEITRGGTTVWVESVDAGPDRKPLGNARYGWREGSRHTNV
jgi:hypothetical protein